MVAPQDRRRADLQSSPIARVSIVGFRDRRPSRDLTWRRQELDHDTNDEARQGSGLELFEMHGCHQKGELRAQAISACSTQKAGGELATKANEMSG